MKIGIITQPLFNNYGGILQNFALQHTLISLGHTPITIDQKKSFSIFRFCLSTIKTILLRVLGRRRSFLKIHRNALFDNFIKCNINTTALCSSLNQSVISKYRCECVIVGSDQVWRPCYNVGTLEDMFLSFIKDSHIKKIAYAASFGVDMWEYDYNQTLICADLAQKFDAISVREESGVELCREYLKVTAQQVLDPTLLLDKSDYKTLCQDIPEENTPFIFAYILDMNNDVQDYLALMESERNMKIKIVSADANVKLSIEQWLSMFRDAAYVVTDSFHGTCFSILFETDFYCIGNKHRGKTRMISLLNIFQLQNRYIELPFDYNELSQISSIDWVCVGLIKRERMTASINYLKDNLR